MFRTPTTRSVTIAGATIALLAVATPALADTPPAPAPTPAIADKPPVDSGAWITPTGLHTTTDTAWSLGWRANRANATIEFSRSKPIKVQGRWQFPTTPSFVVVNGTPEKPGTPGDLATGPGIYRFSKTVTGLKPATTYYAVARIPVGPGRIPVEQAFMTTTKPMAGMPLATPLTHSVSFRVLKVHVSENGDTVGKGEVRFGTRMAPDADPTIPSLWTSWTHTDPFSGYKVSDGQTLALDGLIGGHGIAQDGKAFFEVQGFDDDAITKGGCWPEGGPSIGQQGSSKCRDSAVAQVAVTLPKAAGTHVQTVTAQVYRSPDLRFTADIEVTSERQ
ncbi:MAG: hypothetical protein U0R64_05820 [Candidatus Nanopelagicales bacterium]